MTIMKKGEAMKRVFLRGEEGKFENYLAALSAVGLDGVLSMDLSLADDCDGLLVPGGADVDPLRYGQENTASRGIDPDRDRDEIALIRQFMEKNKPILGICRGEQVLNVALGGTLIQDLPDASHNHDDVADDDRVHPVKTVHPVLKELYGERFVSNSSHHQAVDRLGDGLSVACVGEDGVIEGVIHENGRVLGVQFHPERMSFALRREDADDGAPIFRYFASLL